MQVVGIDVYQNGYGDSPKSSEKSSSDDSDESQPGSSGETVFSSKLRWDLNKSLLQNTECFTLSGIQRYNAKMSFDLINIRGLTEAIRSERWTPLSRELWTMLRPGGYLQMLELDFGGIQSSAGRMATGRADDAKGIEEWCSMYREGLSRLNRNIRIARDMPGIMTSMGFIDVSRTSHQLNIGSWAEDGRVDRCHDHAKPFANSSQRLRR